MAYITTTELAAVLKLRTPTAEQIVELQRVIDATTVEIDAEIDRADDATALTADETQLIEEVLWSAPPSIGWRGARRSGCCQSAWTCPRSGRPVTLGSGTRRSWRR
jgi:hypothetical protein